MPQEISNERLQQIAAEAAKKLPELKWTVSRKTSDVVLLLEDPNQTTLPFEQ